MSPFHIVLCAVFGGTLLYFYLKQGSCRKGKLPPGPRFGLPLVGHLIQLGSKPHLTFLKWKKQYGPVVHFKMASFDAIIISDAKLLKEAFSKEVTAGRLRNPITEAWSSGLGLGNTEGRVWSEQRTFTMRTLKDLGLSKRGILEEMILEEGSRLVKYFEQRTALPLEISGLFSGAILNNIWTIISGDSHDWSESPDLKHIKTCEDYLHAVNHIVETGLLFVPWLRHVLPGKSGYNRFAETATNMTQMARDLVDGHLTGEKDDKKCLIDWYVTQMRGEADPDSSFHGETGKKNLGAVVADLLLAGVDTTSSTLEMAILFLTQYPAVQEKIHKELDSRIGTGVPSLSVKLPYLEAFICETLRRGGLPMGVPHRTLEDMEFHGYHIPKHTTVISDIYSIHHDPKEFPQPNEFRPERFLNEEQTEVVRQESFVPFSVGRRLCLGENLGRSTLFLVLTCLMQRFTVEATGKVDGEDLLPGFILKPKPFKVLFKLRK